MKLQGKEQSRARRAPRPKLEREAAEVWGAELDSAEWRKKFKKTFDLWQSLNPYLYRDLFRA